MVTFEHPTLFLSASKTSTPFNNSVCRINGMFTQFAAATAANGTYLYNYNCLRIHLPNHLSNHG